MSNQRSNVQTFKRSNAIALFLLLIGLVAVAPSNALAQSREFHMDQFNADVTVNQDGSYDVTETLVYVYDSGDFHRGTREIPLGKVDDITDIQVSEMVDGQTVDYQRSSYDPDESDSGTPGTFGTTTEGDNLKIRWVYDWVSNTSKTFQVSYHVTGNIRVYDNRDEFDWYAIPPEWSSPIYASQVNVTVPANVDVSQLKVVSDPEAESSRQGNTITWALGRNSGLEVGIQFPKGVLSVTRPDWQASIDQQENYNANTRPLVDLIVFVLGLLLLVGGVLWAVMTWYIKGRDKPIKLLSDYITEPPSDLPPGLVGTLLDESADVRDVIATVVDQGRKGNLVMAEVDTGGILGLGGRDYEYTQQGNKSDYRFEAMVSDAIFSRGNPVRLSALKDNFYSSLQPIYDEMYRSLVALKYFPENPKGVRARNVGVGIMLLLMAGVTGFLAVMFGETFSNFLLMLPLAFGAMGVVRLVTARAMPRKTDFGAEEAEKWRAFGRYLQQMKRYTDVQAAADKFQKYLPYAVALGYERQLTQQFDAVPSAMPPYYIPYGWGVPYMGSPVGAPMSAGSGQGGESPQFDPAQSMQGMSNSMAGAMQGMSNSFASMVGAASAVLISQPQPQGGGGSSGGGWGGGGGSFGGGGGGGGGGGAD